MRKIKNFIKEKGKMRSDENPCWEGYEMIGTKMKDGRKVPNCVPISKENIKPYLSKNLLEYRKTMKEYNDSIYALHINHREDTEISDTESSYKHKSDKLVYTNSKILPDILNFLLKYLTTNNIIFQNINKKDNLTIEIITNNPNIEILLEKEMSAWRDFEIGEIYAEFE
jgi:hypothetical protein